MNPREAGDLGIPSVSEAVAIKVKWLTRHLMKSRCSFAPPNVKVKGECLARIVAASEAWYKSFLSKHPFLLRGSASQSATTR